MDMQSRYNLTCEAIAFVEENRAIFYGNAKVPKELREFLYLTYNQVFNDSKRPSGCGSCQRNVIDSLKKIYEKYKDTVICQKVKEAPETQTGRKADQPQTQTEDHKVQKTSKRKQSGKPTKNSRKKT